MRVPGLSFFLTALLLAQAAAEAVAQDFGIRDLPVPVETILPGETITADRLSTRQFRTTPQSLSGIATSNSEVIGRETRRRLVAGMPIAVGGLVTPTAIKRGSTSTATYREDGFSISTEVVALSDGGEGDIISARALETGSIIKVEVLAGGELRISSE